MTTFNLRTLKLRSGEQFRDEQEIKLEPLELGGQRYLPVPETVPAELTITRASTGTVFEHAFHVRLHGPCFRCLEDAVLDLDGDLEPVIVLTFGYPRRPLDTESKSAEEWSREANRKRLEEVVRRV